MSEFTRSEQWRRLRAVAAEARQMMQLPKNAPCEVGVRIIPQSTDHPPLTDEEAHALCYPVNDDLEDTVPFKWYVKEVKPNMVLHLYLQERDAWGPQLFDIIVIWVGNDEWEPMIIDPRFVKFTDETP